MQMEELTKTQLVLLVLFVSFVTSLATGIVTVTLVNQAPAPVTQTINRVFEKVVQEKEVDISKLQALVKNPEDLVTALVDVTVPAVVSVIATKDVPVVEQYFINPFGDDSAFGDFLIPQYRQKGTESRRVSSGTGFFVSEDGLLITNKHVVADTDAAYSIVMNDGRKLTAKVLARDPLQDIAILKVDGGNFTYIGLADSDAIKVGQTVVAIGNVLGEFQNTVSLGVVSGLHRSIVAGGPEGQETLSEVIQTDAAINSGNSGGPLLNLSGKAIGINTAMAVGAENVGFALPSNVIRKALEDVRAFGEVRYGYVGVRYVIVTPEIQDEKKLAADHGALVEKNADGAGIIENSPAAKAGLREGDIILSIDGEVITKDNTLSSLIAKKRVGDSLKLAVLRDGAEIAVMLTLEERPASL